MFPAFAIDDKANNRTSNAVFCGKSFALFALLIAGANVANGLLGELGVMSRLAMFGSFAAFRHHIVNVVLMCAKKQMSRIDTGRIIASMKHPQSIGDLSQRRYFITHAMRRGVRMLAVIQANMSIPVLVAMPHPIPTFIGAAHVYLFPKALCEWAECVLCAAHVMTRNVSAFTAWKLGLWERCSATAGAQLWGFVRGMICHSKFSFQNLLTPRDDSSHRRGNFIAVFIIPHIANQTLQPVMQEVAHANFV